MEIVGHIILFLVCMGIAKVVNAMRKALVVNGAAIYLVLAVLLIAINLFVASRLGMSSDRLAYSFGRNIGAAAITVIVAMYYRSEFKADKAHQLRARRQRELSAREDAV